MAATGKNMRVIHREEMLRSDWIVLTGESIVALGSIVVVIGLFRGLKSLLKDKANSIPLATHRRSS